MCNLVFLRSILYVFLNTLIDFNVLWHFHLVIDLLNQLLGRQIYGRIKSYLTVNNSSVTIFKVKVKFLSAPVAYYGTYSILWYQAVLTDWSNGLFWFLVWLELAAVASQDLTECFCRTSYIHIDWFLPIIFYSKS